MTTLTGTKPGNTYKQLLQVGSGNVGLSASLQDVQDGDGTASVLQLSTTGVNITGTATVSGSTILVSGGALGTPLSGNLTNCTGLGKPIVQQVYTITGAVATGTTVVPDDDTIPQNTEGDQYMTLAITPTNASNILIIDVCAHLYNSAAAGVTVIMGLFQDSTANALSVGSGVIVGATSAQEFVCRHIMVAGTTSATTFKVRAGAIAAGTTTFNGATGARKMGGVLNSFMHIQEITV